MALATTLTRQTSIFYTLASAYKVVLCARVQEPNAGDAKTGYDAAGAAGGFGGVLGRLREAGGSMWHARAREKVGGVLGMCGRAKTVCF